MRLFTVLVFLSITFLLVNECVRKKSHKDVELVTKNQYLNKKLDELTEINDRLHARLSDLKNRIEFQNKKDTRQSPKYVAPSKNYEILRRRILSNTIELWNLINGHLNSLSISHRVENYKVERIRQVRKTAGEHYASLSLDMNQLAEVDGYSSWRVQESEELSVLVQNRFRQLQNPSNCAEARKLVCTLQEPCGYTCRLHHIVNCLIVGFVTRRVSNFDDSYFWKFVSDGWTSMYLPLSDTCGRVDNLEPEGEYPEGPDARVILLHVRDAVPGRVQYYPFQIPRDIAPRLDVLHGEPVVWWVGQFLKFILRPRQVVNYLFDEYAKRVKFQTPIVGVQIRRTDKIWESKYHQLDEYMIHVERYYQQKEWLTRKVMKKRVYLATDDPKIFAEAFKKYPEYEIIGDPNVSKSATITKDRDSDQGIIGITLDVHFLSRCDYIVCTFTSNVCRMAFEIMNSFYPDASNRCTSIDGIYTFAHFNRILNEAVFSHRPRRYYELGLSKGDVIVPISNYKNGTSFGTNINTNKSGRYPSFKVSPKTDIGNFTLDGTLW